MKRVGIITHYYNNENMGGLLQAYAMVEIVKKLGYHAEQICYDREKLDPQGRKLQRRLRIVRLLESGPGNLLRMAASLYKRQVGKGKTGNIRKELQIQKEKFKEFESAIQHSELIYYAEGIEQTNQLYDIFICGSDQIWNPHWMAHSAYYLTFAEKEKRKISYAASMGKNCVTRVEEKILKERLMKLDAVSVREESLKRLIEEEMDLKCVKAADPTLILDADQWRRIARVYSVEKQYLFCYFLGDCSWQRKLAVSLAKEQKLEVVSLSYIQNTVRKSDRCLTGIKCYDAGPGEFVSLIEHAQYVLSDSFHAIAFSLNFHKQLIAFNRDGLSGKHTMNSRIHDLLEDFGLLEYLVEKPSDLEKAMEAIEYSKVDKIMAEMRTVSLNWLREALC